MKPPYCELHGLICGDVVSSVSLDGADIKYVGQSAPGRRTSEISDNGRNPRKIEVEARFLTEEDLDAFIAHINSAPEDCTIFPFRDDRCCYSKRAHANVISSQVANIGGATTTFHRARAIFYISEPWMFGLDKGIRYTSPSALPAYVDLEHEGTVEQLPAVDKFCARGSWNVNGYTENLKLTFTPEGGSDLNTVLCDKMMRNDLFEVDRYGNVKHSYENDFDCEISALQTDLHGTDYVHDCTISNGILTISGALQRFILSFYGPLPISEKLPFIDLDIVSIGAYAPKLVAGSLSDLSDAEEIEDIDLHVGINRVYIPKREGTTDLFIGFMERQCWISGPNMITARSKLAGGGTNSSAIAIGGEGLSTVEEWNGTAWSSGGSLNTPRNRASGGGDASAAISMGGKIGESISKVTEEYDGTSWSNGGNLNTGRHSAGGCASGATALIAGGDDGSPYYSYKTEAYNGTSWAFKGDMPMGPVKLNAACGNAGGAFSMCGQSFYHVYMGSYYFDGTSWIELASHPSVSRTNGAAAIGSGYNAIFVGGDTFQSVATTEIWNNVCWRTEGDMLTPRQGHAAGKHLLNDIAVCFGGIGAAPIYPVLRSTELFGTNSSIELRSVRAEVSRYLDPELVPLVNPGDTFELKLDADGCGELTYLEMYFRDAWWF